ncbi:MAG: DUF6605 domain-containing protein [Meiothermus sp.]|nr:DUF6605 domain-containing protein [Meiothermus sp.]
MPGLRITPASQVLSAGGAAVALEAVVTNSNAPVRWAISPNLGSLDTTNGKVVRYIPPVSVTKNESVVVMATLEGTGVQARDTLTIQPATGQTIVLNPISLSLNAGDPVVSFGVGGFVGTLRCTLRPVVGSCAVKGAWVEYAPPAQLEAAADVSLSVGLEGGSVTATARVTVRPRPVLQPSIRLSQTNLSTTYGAAPTRLEAIANTGGTVTWALLPEVGSLSTTTGNAVIYTPPTFVGDATTVILTASLSGTSAQSISIISLKPPSSQTLNCITVDPSDNSSIVGYADRVSYLPGQTAEFKLSVPGGRSFDMAVFRDAHQSELMYFQGNLQGQLQPMPATRPYQQDLGWNTSASLVVPNTWRSGLYRARFIDFAHRTCYHVVFAVKNSSSTRPLIAVLANTFTWQAYNDWGGASLYSCAAGTCDGRALATLLSLRRPNRGVFNPNLSSGTRVVLEWLEQQGYAYDLVTDNDLDSDPTVLDGYRILVLPRHSEYWSANMRNRLDVFLARGGYLVSLGGNQIYWKAVVREGQIEVKKLAADRKHTLANELGGLWRDLNLPEAAVLGNRFTATGMGSANLAPYQVVSPDHWVLAGTGLQAGQSFGAECSGWETDKLDPANSPANAELIARGSNTDPVRHGQAGADMVYHARPEGGAVFAVGSLAFFSDACRNDPIITRITRNVFERFLGR